MKNPIILIFCALLFLGCKNESKNGFAEKAGTQLGQKTDSLKNILSTIERESPILGFGVSIVNADSIIFQKGFGISDVEKKKPYTSKSIQPLASVSKTFIGVAIMILVDQGKLDLDEPINNILPYRIINPSFPNENITIRHLATHTSTITDNFDDGDESIYWLLEDLKINQFKSNKGLTERLTYFNRGTPIGLDDYISNVCTSNGKWYNQENFLNAKPGTKYEYSNLGATVAARIVEIKSGMSFNEFTQKEIFNPLKMFNTGWFYKDIDETLISNLYELDSLGIPLRLPKYLDAGYPEGQLKSNAEDMGKYLQEIVKGFSGDGNLLTSDSYRVLLSPQLTSNHFEERSDYEFDDEYNSGVFWAISIANLRLHNGAMDGVYSFLYINPETNIAAIAFCNLPDNSFGEIRSEIRKFEKSL